MTKNEALKAAIDGKKIFHPRFCNDSYVYFNGRQFMRSHINPKNDFAVGDSMNHLDGYEIVPEYVDFATAWKAYESGKTIKSKSGCTYNAKDIGSFAQITMIIDDIRGKWLILEDE